MISRGTGHELRITMMVLGTEIRRRLIEAVEREGMTLDRERMAIPVVNALVPEVLKIIAEEVKKARQEKHVTREG